MKSYMYSTYEAMSIETIQEERVGPTDTRNANVISE